MVHLRTHVNLLMDRQFVTRGSLFRCMGEIWWPSVTWFCKKTNFIRTSEFWMHSNDQSGSQQTKIALITTLIMSCSCARLVSCTSSWGSKKHAEQTVRRCATSRNVQCVALGVPQPCWLKNMQPRTDRQIRELLSLSTPVTTFVTWPANTTQNFHLSVKHDCAVCSDV